MFYYLDPPVFPPLSSSRLGGEHLGKVLQTGKVEQCSVDAC